MEKEFDRIAGYILEQIDNGKLDDGDVYEFVEQGSRILEQGEEVVWKNAVADLWTSLQEDRNLLEDNNRSNMNSFLLGRIYSVMELIKLMQQHQVADRVLQEDAILYAMDRKKKMVFCSLQDGKSMTHGELARKCGFSDSGLSQFICSIKDKNYILSRKTGRTKYYRLSNSGKDLLRHMPIFRMPEPFGLTNPKRILFKNNYKGLGDKPLKPLKPGNIRLGRKLEDILSTNNSGEMKYEKV